MSCIRFTPADYEAIRHVCGLFGPLHFRPRALQRMLMASLRNSHPTLATRIRRLRIGELSVLCEHFRPRLPRIRHDLTSREVETLAVAYGPLLLNARFSHLLQQVLVRHLMLESPSLAAKLHDLSQEQFREVCERVRGCIQ